MKQNKFILFFFVFGCIACQMDSGLSPEEAQKAILGKWEMVSYGEDENDMVSNYSRGYTEYLSDGTLRSFAFGNFPGGKLEDDPEPERTDGGYGPIQFYTIDGDYLKIMQSKGGLDGWMDCFKYTFYDNNKMLRLTRYPLIQRDKSGNFYHIFITNIIIYKKN